MSSVKNLKHGQSSHPNGGNATKEYNTWGLMLKRCNNPNSADYPIYGGRGIAVCDRWSESFEAFFLDMGAAPTSAHSIDRIDPNRGYQPDNCRWSSAKEQRRNQRDIPIIEHDGKALSPMEWAELTGIPNKRIYARIHRGWSVERTLTTPV